MQKVCSSKKPVHACNWPGSLRVLLNYVFISGVLAGLASCGGGTSSTGSHTVGGTVSGLTGNGLTLQNNGADDYTVNADGVFSFTAPLADGSNYNVTVKTEPSAPSQTCLVNGGNGTISGANVTGVAVACTTNTYTIGGNVNGLIGAGLVLQNNGSNDLSKSADGSFTFTTPVVSGANYNVTVKTQPSGQTCSISNGSGTISNTIITNVSVLCTASGAKYAVGGTVRGIALGKSIILKNNGTDDITVTSDGSFNFPTKQNDDTPYDVTINTLPSGEDCAKIYDKDKIRGDDVKHVSIICGTPPSGSFSAAASLNTGRSSHSATLLPDGKVLVAGGVITATAELYDSSTNSWSYAASMSTARYDHTATLLPNGKVLVAGGCNGSTYFSSAELYDPANNTWSSAGNMSVARMYHTATLLRNGKVLVVGGTYGPALTNSTELYDPATNSWSSAGTLATARYLHSATLLADGKVLIAAGAIGTPAIASAELYDPATNTWSVTSSLASARAYATANMLPSGKVLVTGGFDSSLGSGTNSIIGNAELYDPVTGTWSSAGNLNNPRMAQTAISGLLPTGKVMFAGGHNTVSYLSSVEVYDPATNSWSLTGSMSTARAFHSATLMGNGHMLVVGGAIFITSAEIY